MWHDFELYFPPSFFSSLCRVVVLVVLGLRIAFIISGRSRRVGWVAAITMDKKP